MQDDLYVSTGSSTGIATVNVRMQPGFLFGIPLNIDVVLLKNSPFLSVLIIYLLCFAGIFILQQTRLIYVLPILVSFHSFMLVLRIVEYSFCSV